MADTIRRDVAGTFDPTDEHQLAEFEGFSSDVPSTYGLIFATNFPGAPEANRSAAHRAAKIFHPSLVAGVDPRGVPRDDGATVAGGDVLAGSSFAQTDASRFLDVLSGADQGSYEIATVVSPTEVRLRHPGGAAARFAATATGLSYRVHAEADLPTPDKVTPDVTFERQGLHDVTLRVPRPGNSPLSVPIWSWRGRNPDAPDGWPGPTIRVREGKVVHSRVNARTGPHTIHHHGIEPTAMNDGVGHLTFEVKTGDYVYQWKAGEAGTYFYHCHRNTALHFERGMYGLLLIDPDVPGAPFADGGPGVTYFRNDPVAYDAEALWVVDDIDLRWHGVSRGDGLPVIDHVASGIQAIDTDGRSGFVRIGDRDENPLLHRFQPDVVVVSGVPAEMVPGVGNRLIATEPGTAVTPRVTRVPGQVTRLLVRTLNAAYCQTRWTFPEAIPGWVVAADGRTLGREPFGRYSRPFTLASVDHRFKLTTAQRWDVLLEIRDDVPAGDHEVEITLHHHIGDATLKRVRLKIVVE